MKTFDSEKKELVEWLNNELEKLETAWKCKYLQNGTYTGGQDSVEEKERHRVLSAYNRKLLALKKKYER